MNNLIASGKRYRVILADCLEAMAGMEENSVDAVVCDPPYGLNFMGKAWDHGIPGIPFWREALRVVKPGAYLLAFGGTRTFHRLAVAIEDAGWVLRDTLSWNYGSGFPKSHDISKGIDRKVGAERQVVGVFPSHRPDSDKHENSKYAGELHTNGKITAPATPEAKQWDGWGTALKPAWEPVILAQAPLEGTYAENVLKWGCGALNIDGCRIGKERVSGAETGREIVDAFTGEAVVKFKNKQGRWPANFLLSHTVFCEKVGEKKVRGGNATKRGGSFIFQDTPQITPKDAVLGYADPDGKETVEDWRCVPDCPVAILDGQSGELKSGGKPGASYSSEYEGFYNPGSKQVSEFYGSAGGASRFFYCAKASSAERNAGLEAVHTLFEWRGGFGETITDDGREKSIDNPYLRGETMRSNNHPTVKPIAILRYLCRLVTPPAGIVLDPFAGSGSTGCAAAQEGFQFVGIEKEKEYAEIARARIAHFSQMP